MRYSRLRRSDPPVLQSHVRALLRAAVEEIALELRVTSLPHTHDVVQCGNHRREAGVVEEAISLRRCEEEVELAVESGEEVDDLGGEVHVAGGEEEVEVRLRVRQAEKRLERVVIGGEVDRLLLERREDHHVGVGGRGSVAAAEKRLHFVAELRVGLSTGNYVGRGERDER